MGIWLNWLMLLLASSLYAQESEDVDGQTYTAAVFEHARVGSEETDSLEVIVEKNLDIYNLATKTAVKKGADIIVFPDYGLFPTLRKRKNNLEILEIIPPLNFSNLPNPCNQPHEFYDRPILTSLSCMARDQAIYLVAGMGGLLPCSKDDDDKCPDDGVYQLNTAVAFDKRGYLVARYFKDHLFFERTLDRAPEPQPANFDTEFGKFAIVSSFDLLFNSSIEAVDVEGVQNVIFPTQWFDELPFLTSIQAQEMFAVRMGVNLLAANLNLPYRETVGSGIYSCAQGALRYTYNPDKLSKLVIAKVPQQPGKFIPEEKFPILMIRDGEVTEYPETDDSSVSSVCSAKILGTSKTEYRCNERDFTDFTLKKLIKNQDDLNICTNETCCSLHYKLMNSTFDEDYYLAAFKGDIVIENRYSLNVEICSLVRCDSFDGKECAVFPLQSSTTFEEIVLSGTFHDKYVFPSIVHSKQRLGPARNWKYEFLDGKASLKANSFDSPLLVASLFGRCYASDPPYNL